jgi:heat shock protein HtpX
MSIFRRVFLFLAVNALVVTTISVLLSVLGVRPYLTSYGLDIPQLAIFCLVWGMGGALISLAMSRAIAKWTMGIQLIDTNTPDPRLQELVSIIRELTRRLNLPMPEIGIYDSPEVNAFATGPTRNRALVAVSTGLLGSMDREEVSAVLGHEISHVANGDMVTMTLLQGIVNAFVMFLARIVAFAITMGRSNSEEEGPGFAYYIVEFALQIVFLILGSIVIAAFSRWREYRADAGGAKLAGAQSMIRALSTLKQLEERPAAPAPAGLRTLMLSDRTSGWLHLFASHPRLEDRIARLQSAGQ